MVAVHIAEIMTGIVSCLPSAVTSGIQNFSWMTILRCNDTYIYIYIYLGGGERATLQILALVIVFKRQIPGVGLLNDLP